MFDLTFIYAQCAYRTLVDMYRCVSGHYYELFYTLEEQQLLNPLNDTDLYCLHYVFLP